LLEHFTGSVQFTVRARYLRDEVLADLVAENPDVARLRETIAGTTETQTRQARIQLGELIVQAFDQIRPHHAEHIVTAIQPVVQQMQQREVGQVEDVVELAVLVSSDEVKRFEDALESVASELHARIDFQLLGPQAPYDFVGIDEWETPMGLISSLFTAPLAPLKGTVWVAERIQEEAERQYYDPGVIRRQLEEIAQARAAGQLSDEEATELETELVQRLMTSTRRRQ